MTTTWAEFESARPEMAAEGRRLLYARNGEGLALLATVRGTDEPPRIHPINVEIRDGELYAFLFPSGKKRDLEADRRYALHAHQDPAAPDEFLVRGRARRVDDPTVRDAIAAQWPFTPGPDYVLYAFGVESVTLGRRGPDEWPPRYTRWQARTELEPGVEAG